MDPNSIGDRRVGARQNGSGRVRWLPPYTRSWLGWRRERREPDRYASVEDVSVTGARLVVPRTPGLETGAIAGVEAEGHIGKVEVRWIETHDDPSLARVGVEFKLLSPDLETRIHDLIADDRRESIDWRWEIAR
jgi:hypothetical protein